MQHLCGNSSFYHKCATHSLFYHKCETPGYTRGRRRRRLLLLGKKSGRIEKRTDMVDTNMAKTDKDMDMDMDIIEVDIIKGLINIFWG